MLGSDLLTRAATILQDSDNTRWPLAELVNWINDGQRAVVLAKPSANAQSVVFSLVLGTLQSLTEASHLLLLRIPRNITAVGPPRNGGRAVRPTTREMLDSSEPNWHDPLTVTFKREVRQYVYDEENPREFYVYPGNDGTGKVEAVVSVLPTDLEADGDATLLASYESELGLVETYSVPLLDYVLYRAFGKDDVAGDAGRAQMHYNAFAAALGIKIQSEAVNSPNARARVTST